MRIYFPSPSGFPGTDETGNVPVGAPVVSGDDEDEGEYADTMALFRRLQRCRLLKPMMREIW